MSMSPKDMDFLEAKHTAAREIALALGVPPMLLAIPGDNTFANYQEANRTFWRQTVIPLVQRTADALSTWLAPAYAEPLTIKPDLDSIDALSSEREALWTRLEKASFLTNDEKRAAVGYGPMPANSLAQKINIHHDSQNGQFTFAPEGPQPASRRRGAAPGTPAQEARLSVATTQAEVAQRQLRELEPNWQATPGIHSSDIEGQIRNQEFRATEATARYNDLTQGAIPGVNPAWGYQRLREELLNRGYEYQGPARNSAGELFRNQVSGEEVRIMERPARDQSYNPPVKSFHDFYYRYRSADGKREGSHVPIPNK
jgi:Phage portal protein